jgi:hypothetical protein
MESKALSRIAYKPVYRPLPAAPDWRELQKKPAPTEPLAVPQLRLHRRERDWFYWLAYSRGIKPGVLARRFAEAYANGASIPFVAELGEPRRSPARGA